MPTPLVESPARAPERGPGFPARPDLRQRMARLDVKVSPYLYVAPFFIVFGIVGLFPLLYTGYVSLFDWELIEDSPDFIGLDNYVTLMADAQFWKVLVNTLSIFLLSSIPQIIIAVLIAYFLNAKLRAPTVWRVSVLLPYVASLVALGIIFANLFGPQFGLVNSILETLGIERIDWQADRFSSHVAIAVMVNWRWTGYNALIFLAGLQSIPNELHEAAQIDGASRVQEFFHVTIPLLRPVIVFTVILSTIGGLQIFAEPYLFAPGVNIDGGSNNQFLTTTLYLYGQGFRQFKLGYASAIAMVLFAIIVVTSLVNLWLARRIRSTDEEVRA